MKNEIFITKGKLEKIKEELEYYIHTKRPEVVEQLQIAKSFGDLSENAEYDAAKEQQAFVEAKIKELEVTITNAKIIDENIKTDEVTLGTTVTYQNVDTDEKFMYEITGYGANPLSEDNPTISSSTPIARGLFGMKVGEVVTIDIPKGQVTLKVLEIK